jgi:AcrR family transcriptional regulator
MAAPAAVPAPIEAAAAGRPRNDRCESNILATTMRLLAAQGYWGFTIDMVAAQAHCSKSTIYRRWPSKEQLVMAAFDHGAPPLKDVDKGSLVEDLLDMVLQFVAIVRATPLSNVLPALIGEQARTPALADLLNPWIERRRGPVKAIVQRAIQRGELPKGVDVDLAEDAVMGPVLLRLFFTPRSPLGRTALRDLVRIVVRGLGGKV